MCVCGGGGAGGGAQAWAESWVWGLGGWCRHGSGQREGLPLLSAQERHQQPTAGPPFSSLCLPALQSEDKTLRLCNDMWHILVREKGNEKICAALADWMLERAA